MILKAGNPFRGHEKRPPPRVAFFSVILSADIEDPELTMLAVIFAGTFRLM
jgi:hypothetical protein